MAAVEFGLAREFMLPLRELPRVPDPLSALVGALAQASSGELAVVQVLFEETQAPWASAGLDAVTSPDGNPFFLDAPEVTDQAREKFQSPLYAVVLRVMVVSQERGDAGEVLRAVASALSQYGDPGRNALVPMASEDLDELVRDILTRSTHRSGMLLSLSELTSIVRVPSEHVRSRALIRTPEVEELLPADVLGQGAVIGRAKHRRLMVPVRLSEEARLQHTYVIGASGTGKSTLLLNLILQDIAAGHGVGVLDPHGDLVDEVLGRIPDFRTDDDDEIHAFQVGWLKDFGEQISFEMARSELERMLTFLQLLFDAFYGSDRPDGESPHNCDTMAP